MSVHSEWELLKIADDIEQGDTVDVDAEGEIMLMMFKSESSDHITLIDTNGDVHKFNPETLESLDGEYWTIEGKSGKQLPRKAFRKD